VGGDRLGGGGDVSGEHLLGAGAGERGARRQEFVCHHTEGVEIGPVIHVGVGHRLLRRHVGRCAQRHAHRGERLTPGGLAQRLGHAEVHDQGMSPAEHDVLGLEIAVDDAMAVGLGQRVGDVAQDPDAFADRELPFLHELLAQRQAGHVRHDVEQQVVRRAGVVQRQDVGVLQGGRHLDLAEEPFLAERGRELFAQQLERDLAVVPEVVSEVDGRHATGTELALDGIAAGEGGPEAVRHDQAGSRIGGAYGSVVDVEVGKYTDEGAGRQQPGAFVTVPCGPAPAAVAWIANRGRG
jgi:hypothetical protein